MKETESSGSRCESSSFSSQSDIAGGGRHFYIRCGRNQVKLQKNKELRQGLVIIIIIGSSDLILLAVLS